MQRGIAMVEANGAEAGCDLSALVAGVLSITSDAIISVDAGQRIRFFNQGAEEIFGWAAHEVLGRDLSVLLPARFADSHRELVQRFGAGGDQSRLMEHRPDVCGRRRDGSEFPAEASIAIATVEGQKWCTVLLRDVTERRAHEQAVSDAAAQRLHSTQAQLAAIVESSEDAIIGLSLAGVIETWNLGAQKMYGYEPEEIIGSHARLLTADDGREIERHLDEARCGRAVLRHETSGVQRDGSTIKVSLTMSPVYNQAGAITGASSVAHDITQRKRIEAELAHQALHDRLTGLPNRVLLNDRLDHALARCERRGEHVVVLFLDLDGFKLVNDSRGHSAGDAVLVEVARRLREAVRPSDTVARFGGDEFVIVSENGDPHHGAVLGRRIADVLEVPFEAAQVSAVPRASIGTVVGGARDTAEGLLKKADLAMYEAKHRGRGRVEAFHQDFQARLDHRVSLEAALRSAVEEGGFRLVYQPIVSLDSGRIVGAEALLRWDAPDPAWSMPDAFIGLAEETGLIAPIGSWVNAEVARQLKAWSPFLQDDPDFSVSVNLSGLQLTPDLADFLISLREHNIEPGRVTFELTETVLIADAEPSIEALLGLRLLGVGLAIDDFGTGYSSLSYLERLPVDSIKIDRSFVEGLGKKRQSVAIVSAIIRMAAALGLRVTAEGVETEEQLDTLVALGCTQGQGFYWSAGVSGAELAALLGAPTPVRPQAAAVGTRSSAEGPVPVLDVRRA